jgi:osomolarity two-component system sensor histidine kinase NIK1
MDILLVEDNLLNQKVVTFNLRKKNYNVIAVADGKEAVEVYFNNKFDLILMDIMLPQMDGYEITKVIRDNEKQTNEHVPIIALTANALENDREKCLNAGMDDYLAKPFTALELYATMEKFLEKD